MKRKWNTLAVQMTLLLAVCLTLVSNAAAATCSEASIEWVNKSYVAYYGRPADPGGLDYWACRLDAAGGNLSSIIDAFGVSEEFNIRYGSLSNDQLLDTIYQQMFNRDPDPGGKEWYLSKLESGEMNLQTITLFVLGGASGDDSAIINNKLHIASYFTERLRSAQRRYDSINEARDLVSGVNETIGSRDFALSYCDSLIDSWSPLAGTPSYITVQASDSDGSYPVSWGASDTDGVTYELEEATDSTFTTGLRSAYIGPERSTNIDGRDWGTTYYYRVKATRYGMIDSDWQTGTTGCQVAAAGVSFSPVWYSETLSWRYQINGGKPSVTSIEGMPITIYFNDLLLTMNPATQTRNASFSGTVAGVASGNFTASVAENLAPSSGRTLITGQNLSMNMNLTIEDESATIILALMTHFTPAAEWFLDRTDLDRLPIGYVYNEQDTITGTASGSISVSGYGSMPIPYTQITSPEIWQIVGKEASVLVKGKRYTDIVKVTRSTLVPALDLSGKSQNMTITYWVAKGIGMVKGEGYLNFLGSRLTVELMQTNLTQ